MRSPLAPSPRPRLGLAMLRMDGRRLQRHDRVGGHLRKFQRVGREWTECGCSVPGQPLASGVRARVVDGRLRGHDVSCGVDA